MRFNDFAYLIDFWLICGGGVYVLPKRGKVCVLYLQ